MSNKEKGEKYLPLKPCSYVKLLISPYSGMKVACLEKKDGESKQDQPSLCVHTVISFAQRKFVTYSCTSLYRIMIQESFFQERTTDLQNRESEALP
jgi:hypothetical protein